MKGVPVVPPLAHGSTVGDSRVLLVPVPLYV